MIKRVGVLHTVVFLAEMFRKLFDEVIPEAENFHVVDECILRQLMAAGGLTPGIVRRIALQASLIMEGGADLILFTCSSTSPAVDVVRPLIDIPILKIDDPMTDKAVALGKRIGVVTTAKTTLKASVDLIHARAVEKGKTVEVISTLEMAAFEARLNGNVNEHDRLVELAIAKLSERCDVIVLAQASMSHLSDKERGAGFPPVLAGPQLCMSALKEVMDCNPALDRSSCEG